MSARKKKRKLKKIIWFILFIGIIAGAIYFGPKFLKQKPAKQKPTTPAVEEPKEQVYKLSLIAAGDALLHNAVNYSAENTDGTYDFNSQFDLIRDIIGEYDLAFYNQEALIGGNSLGIQSYPRFNAPEEYGRAAIAAGFNIVSLANNHSMDMGEKGAIGSYNYWKESGIMFNGHAISEETRTEYMIGEKNNITYGFLAYTTSTNGLPVPSGKSYLVNTYNQEKVDADINAIRDKVDVLIVSMHWGVEYTLTPPQEEKNIAQHLSDMNVDIVIGNHAHCIQPIVRIGDTVVFYALGNLISNQGILENKYGKKVSIGALGTVDITKTIAVDGTTTIDFGDVGADLIYTYTSTPGTSLSRDRVYLIVPFSKMEEKYLNNYETVYNDFKGVLQKLDSSIKVVDLKSRLAN